MGANAQTAVPVFTANQVLTAAEVTQINTGVPVFATTTTRDAAFGGTGEKTLAEGQACYIEAAPKRLEIYNGTTWIEFDADYTTFTPTWNIGYTRGNGTTVAKYQRVGKTVFVWITETLGTTSAVTGIPTLTLPLTIANADVFDGTSVLEITGASYSQGSCTPLGTTQAEIWAINTSGTYAGIGIISATVPFTWATGYKINISMNYEYA